MVRSKWCPEFETRRKFCLQDENVTWIERLSRIDPDFDVDEIVPIFMSLDASPTCTPRANFMEERFGTLRRSDLQSLDRDNAANVLLDECAFRDQTQYRIQQGPLTARQLYEHLKKPRFQVPQTHESTLCAATNITDTKTAADPAETGVTEIESDGHEPDAERRVIYISDPDQWSVLALISGASFGQTGSLRNVLYRHFMREAYVGMTTTTTGLPMFELAFHLPFRAWRSSRDGQIPEGSRDVSFLDLERQEPAFMLQGSYSCGVNGVDNWRWTAYCFIDTGQDEFNDERESAEGHYFNIPQGLHPPPSPCGNAQSWDPGPEARLFFLRTLQVRLTMVREEWMQVVQQLESSVAQYQKMSISGVQPGDRYTPTTIMWLDQIQSLTHELSADILRSWKACNDFVSKYAEDLDDEALGKRCLALNGIEAVVEDLASLTDRLEALISHIGLQQRSLAQENKAVSVILMICTPVLLTSGIFSMEDDVRKQTFPSIAASPGWFFSVFVIFTSIIFAAALQQKLVRLPLQRLLTLSMEMLPQLYQVLYQVLCQVLQAGREEGLPQAFQHGRRWRDPYFDARRATFTQRAQRRQGTQDPGISMVLPRALLRRPRATTSTHQS